MANINSNITNLINEAMMGGFVGSIAVTATISGLRSIYNHLTSVDTLKKNIFNLEKQLSIERNSIKKAKLKIKLDNLQLKLKTKIELLKFKHEKLINDIRTKESNLKFLQQKSRRSTEDNQKITALQNEIRDSRVVLAKLGIYK